MILFQNFRFWINTYSLNIIIITVNHQQNTSNHICTVLYWIVLYWVLNVLNHILFWMLNWQTSWGVRFPITISCTRDSLWCRDQQASRPSKSHQMHLLEKNPCQHQNFSKHQFFPVAVVSCIPALCGSKLWKTFAWLSKKDTLHDLLMTCATIQPLERIMWVFPFLAVGWCYSGFRFITSWDNGIWNITGPCCHWQVTWAHAIRTAVWIIWFTWSSHNRKILDSILCLMQ